VTDKQVRQRKGDDQMTDGNHIFSGLKVLDLASFIAGSAAIEFPREPL
jgi:hypothetical protein